MYSYDGQRVLITGGGRGLGRHMARAFAASGANVSVAARSKDQLELSASDVRAEGREAWSFPVDLYDVAQAQRLVDDAAAAMGGIDVLVNNAGGWGNVAGAVGPILEATVEGFDAVYHLNVRSPLFATIGAARHMIEQKSGGSILNVASVDALAPAPTEALYASAKAAVRSLTETLAYEFGTHGIRVNAVAPGVVETELTAPWLQTEEQRADRASFYPLNRIGTPDDVTAAALYLCSAAAGWVSGITLPVCGGQFATSDIFRWVRAHNFVPDAAKI